MGDSNLGEVLLQGVKGSNITDRTNCPGQVGLIDLTKESASVHPGGNYTLHFQATTCDTGWSRLAYAFLDFDSDGVYDSDELLGTELVDNRVAPYNVYFNFSVPCLKHGSVAGRTRMRVFVVESGFNPNPCLLFSYGGAKEFSIVILPNSTGHCH